MGTQTAEEKITWKALTVRIPVEVHTALKVRAAAEASNMALIVEKLIREYLNRGQKS